METPMTVTELSEHRNVKHFKSAAIQLHNVIQKIESIYSQQAEANEDISKVRAFLNASDLSDVERQQHAKIDQALSTAIDCDGYRQEVIDILEEVHSGLAYVVSFATIDQK